MMSSHFEIDFVILGRPTTSVKLPHTSTSFATSWFCLPRPKLWHRESLIHSVVHCKGDWVHKRVTRNIMHREIKVNKFMSKFYPIFPVSCAAIHFNF